MLPTPSPESYTTVTRRPLDVEDYIDILRRHKGWIFGPAFAAMVVAVVVAYLWPDTFVSTAVIRVVPPQIPESLVMSNINSELSQRISSMWQTISSRNNLGSIITMHNLYPQERQRLPMDDVAEMMRREIKVGSVSSLARGDKEVSAFQISFSYDNRYTAQKVTQELVSRFMTENTRERTSQSVMTTAFLRDQVEAAKKELDAIEERLTAFQQTYQGRLPDQVQQNQLQLNMLEQRVSNANSALARVNQEKMLLESDLRTYRSQRAAMIPAPDQIVQKQQNEMLLAKEREIRQLETLMANLREQYKEAHPDVRRVNAQLGVARKQHEQMLKDEDEAKAKAAAAPPSRRYDPLFEKEKSALDAAIERVEAQIKAKSLEADTYNKELANTERQIKNVQARIETTPAGQQQYADLIRERELANLKYEDLNKKRSSSAISEEVERRQQGETLEVLDQASLPLDPTEPKRLVIIGGGAMVGLIAGLLLSGAREAKDTSLKNLKDVRAYTQLPILGSVPLLENDQVVRRRKRLTWLAWCTACLVGICIMTGSVLFYYGTRV
jgi:polysaccharide chain length determinant protein (PEP-CTERM system associated)